MKNYIIIISIALVLGSCKGTKSISANQANTPVIETESKKEDTRASNSKEASTQDFVRTKSGTTGATANMPGTATDKNNTLSMERKEEDGQNQDVVAQTSGSTGAALQTSSYSNEVSTTNFEKLYDHLDMTDEQIEKFRTAMRDLGNSMGGGSNSVGSIEEEQRKQFKAILSYDQYEKWQSENP